MRRWNRMAALNDNAYRLFKFTCQTSDYILGPEGYLLFYTIGPDKTGIGP